jgi:uncharacterized membrane protein (DUF2068 family)
MKLRSGIRAIAIIEASKGVLVFLVGFGLLALLHENLQALAERLVTRFHLNPIKHYPRIFLEAAAQLTDTHLKLLALLAAVYAVVRMIEAYGLWWGRRWAEWFAALSSGIYMPFEIYELFNTGSLLAAAALIVNTAVVALMVRALRGQPSI